MTESGNHSSVQENRSPAKVFLVGAGPGDPELLTVKAVGIIRRADVILYDSLVGPGILDLAQANCEKVFVGKRAHRHSYSQSEINEMIYERALAHATVVRLKGGDPFIFGRGGEEVEYLRARGIPLEVIPGITAATAASAILQIPLTHRELGESVIFLSGYSKADGGKPEGFPDHDWNFLAKSSLTIVFYMGQHHLARICDSLIAAGKPEDTPVSLVSNCSLPDQSVLVTDLKRAAAEAISASIRFPAILIIGNVLRLIRPDLIDAD